MSLTDLFADLTGSRELPVGLAAALDRLRASSWPEVSGRWSRLTPSGYPVELTVGGSAPRWTAEVAGPELPDAARLPLALSLLGLDRPDLLAAQEGVPLRFGAWIGGREDGRAKLYAELPALPPPLLPFPLSTEGLPAGTVPRMLGIEPATGRTELYLRLPTLDVVELAPYLWSLGFDRAVESLSRLPDGLARLSGRRLGLSLAVDGGGAVAVAFFASARTLFPVSPPPIPALAGIGTPHRLGLVTVAPSPSGDVPSLTVGVTPLCGAGA